MLDSFFRLSPHLLVPTCSKRGPLLLGERVYRAYPEMGALRGGASEFDIGPHNAGL
jgi:hypothetical protein